MTKQKQVFRHFCKFLKNRKLKYHNLDPLLSTLLKHLRERLQPWVYLGMTLQAWHTYIWGVSHIFLCRSSQSLSGWMGSIAAQLFSGLSTDVRSGSSPDFGWATQGQSETCPKATPVLSWLCAYGHCPVGEPSSQSIPKSSGAGFHQGSLFTLLRSSFPQSWLVSQSLLLKNIPTAWCCHHHAWP